GTGSYVSRDLFWYRSTLAHNAPRLDGASQSLGAAVCEAFDISGEWAWVRGRYGEITRTVVAGPAYLLDVIELASRSEHVLELPWHFAGTGDVERGRWTSGGLADEVMSRDAGAAVRRAPRPGAGRGNGEGGRRDSARGGARARAAARTPPRARKPYAGRGRRAAGVLAPATRRDARRI